MTFGRPVGIASVLAAVLAMRAWPQETPSFEASRELVRIDVVALDADGRAVRGLTADDFEVSERGRKLPITSFEAVVVMAPPPPEGHTPGVSAPAPADPERNRAFVVLFDDRNLTPSSAANVRTDLEKFLTSGLRDGDIVSLVTTSGLPYTARTTEERRRMAASVARLVGRKEVDIEMTGDGLRIGMKDSDAQAADGLSAIARALSALEGFRGRKSLIVYSEGYAATPYVAQSEFDQVVELARRTRVSIFFADAYRDGGGGTPASGRMPEQAGTRRDLALHGDAAGTAYVAVATGGRAASTADQAALFREAAEQASAYYLLGFDPPDGKDGERKVKVRSRKGLALRAPDRYFVRGGQPAVTDAASALRSAMASMFDADGVAFGVSTGWRAGVSSTTFTVSLARSADDPPRKLDLRIEARPLGAGEPVRDAAELTVPPGGTPARLDRDLPLRPGHWQARVAVRDRDTGRVGSVLHSFEVKDTAATAP